MTGPAIREARQRLGLSQEQLATLCGWESTGRISDYERGARVPSPRSAALIEAALAGDPIPQVRAMAEAIRLACAGLGIEPASVALQLGRAR